MRVAVIGAGVVGVTTAYELGADGHEVTVFERRGTVAAEASFANAGLVAPGYVTPWAAPGMPRKVLRAPAGARTRPVRFGGRSTARPSAGCGAGGAPASRRPTAPTGRACTVSRYFSRDRLHELTAQLHLDFERADGFLVLLRSAQGPGARRARASAPWPSSAPRRSCSTRRLPRGSSRASTPRPRSHAGIHSQDDEVGNCREFTHLLRREAERIGVRFRFDTQVERIVAGPRPVLRSRPRRAIGATRPQSARAGSSDWSPTEPGDEIAGELSFDAVVVCAALGSVALLRPLGVRLPLQPVYGYSVTAPLRHDERTCTSSRGRR